MDDIIKRILGEAEADDEKKDKKPKAEKPEPKPSKSKSSAEPAVNSGAPEEAEIDELAHMWTQGNRDDVAQRFLAMDNETAVKVVFAIGREGALELARMADTMLEQQGDEEGTELPLGAEEGPPGAESQATTEPASVESPEEAQGYPARQILGVGR